MKKKNFVFVLVLAIASIAGLNYLKSESAENKVIDLAFDNVEASALCEISGGGLTSECTVDKGKKCHLGELVSINCSRYYGR